MHVTTDNKHINVLKQLFYSLKEEDRQKFISSILDDKNNEETTLATKYVPMYCPHCGADHFVKNGVTKGIQRFLCRSCKKTFATTTGTILHATKKNLFVWERYIHCMMNKMSLRKCADECGISLFTSFTWRHKILDALQKMQDSVTLGGIVEADETFTRISYKGNHNNSINFKMPRKAYKRGTKATCRGLSKEQVCIPCGINLAGLSIAKVATLESQI